MGWIYSKEPISKKLDNNINRSEMSNQSVKEAATVIELFLCKKSLQWNEEEGSPKKKAKIDTMMVQEEIIVLQPVEQI